MEKYKWYFNKYSQYDIIEETEDWLYCIKKKDFKVDYKANFFDSYSVEKPFEMNSSIFNSCPFKNKIFKNYNVEFICLSGSGMYKCIDNISDYDLDVFVDANPDFSHHDHECLFYKGRKLHWYYWTIEDLYKQNSFTVNSILLKFIYLNYNNIIYDKENLSCKLFNNKNNFINIAVDRLLHTNIINIKLHSRTIVTYLILYSYLFKVDISDLILRVKRSDFISIADSSVDERLSNILLALYNFSLKYLDKEIINKF